MRQKNTQLSSQLNLVESQLNSIDPTKERIISELQEVSKQDIVNFILERYEDLRDVDWTAWHVLQMNRVGFGKYSRLAEEARKRGKDPARYFTTLLKNTPDERIDND